MVWHANPHLASFACGGSLFRVPGENLSEAESYSNTAYPHPPLSANLLLSFTMKSTSCSVPGTVAAGNVSIILCDSLQQLLVSNLRHRIGSLVFGIIRREVGRACDFEAIGTRRAM